MRALVRQAADRLRAGGEGAMAEAAALLTRALAEPQTVTVSLHVDLDELTEQVVRAASKPPAPLSPHEAVRAVLDRALGPAAPAPPSLAGSPLQMPEVDTLVVECATAMAEALVGSPLEPSEAQASQDIARTFVLRVYALRPPVAEAALAAAEQRGVDRVIAALETHASAQAQRYNEATRAANEADNARRAAEHMLRTVRGLVASGDGGS